MESPNKEINRTSETVSPVLYVGDDNLDAKEPEPRDKEDCARARC